MEPCNARNQNSRPQDITFPRWLLQCTCPIPPCTCLAKLKPDILRVLGAPIDSRGTKRLSIHRMHLLSRQISQYRHSKKATKYNPLIQALRIARWQVNPLITIIVGVREAIHETLMKQLHQIAIEYLTYLILNKRKPDNNKPPIDPPLPLDTRPHTY